MWFNWKNRADKKIEIGGIYIIHRERSPWTRDECKAKVIEALDGWVKYRFIHDGKEMTGDQEEKTKMFLRVFTYAGK